MRGLICWRSCPSPEHGWFYHLDLTPAPSSGWSWGSPEETFLCQEEVSKCKGTFWAPQRLVLSKWAPNVWFAPNVSPVTDSAGTFVRSHEVYISIHTLGLLNVLLKRKYVRCVTLSKPYPQCYDEMWLPANGVRTRSPRCLGTAVFLYFSST